MNWFFVARPARPENPLHAPCSQGTHRRAAAWPPRLPAACLLSTFPFKLKPFEDFRSVLYSLHFEHILLFLPVLATWFKKLSPLESVGRRRRGGTDVGEGGEGGADGRQPKPARTAVQRTSTIFCWKKGVALRLGDPANIHLFPVSQPFISVEF